MKFIKKIGDFFKKVDNKMSTDVGYHKIKAFSKSYIKDELYTVVLYKYLDENLDDDVIRVSVIKNEDRDFLVKIERVDGVYYLLIVVDENNYADDVEYHKDNIEGLGYPGKWDFDTQKGDNLIWNMIMNFLDKEGAMSDHFNDKEADRESRREDEADMEDMDDEWEDDEDDF